MNSLLEIKKELIKSPVPFYLNFVGKRRDLLNKAIESVPKDICELRLLKHSSPIPFTRCLNRMLEECLDNKDKNFIFMHYDAEILDKSIILEIVNEWKHKEISKRTHGNNASNPAFVSACGLTDLLVLFDVETINDLGGWDENLKNSFMELDLMNRCHMILPSIPYPILYPNVTEVKGKLIHKSASALRNREAQENIKHVYDISMPKDFEYFHKKWPPGCTAINLEDKHRQLKEYDRMRKDIILNHGYVEDVAMSIDLRYHLEVVKKSQRDFEASSLCRKEIKRQKQRLLNKQAPIDEVKNA